jgi:hypothetical protein
MSITTQAKSVIERPLDRNRVKSRQGGGGMTFDYIPTEYAIQLLNEAFDYAWDTNILKHDIHDGLAVALVELRVWDENGNPIVKQQFGSCNINRGVDIGAALKGASSDGLKKCASQLGLALELYLDEIPAAGFKAPSRTAPSSSPPPSKPVASSAPVSKPPVSRPPPAAKPSSPASALPRPVGGANTAAVSRPTPSSLPPAPKPQPGSVAASARVNPFEKTDVNKGITTVQMNALTSLAERKNVSPSDLILQANIVDGQGIPKQNFEDLTHAEAINVVKAAQLN